MSEMEIEPLESLVRRLFIPNAMLLLYLGSVSLGITLAMVVGHYTVGFFEGKLITALYQYGPYFDFPITIITIAIILVYERPIRRVFHKVNSSKKLSAVITTLTLPAFARLYWEPSTTFVVPVVRKMMSPSW